MPTDNPFAPLKTALKFLAFPAEVILVDHFLRHNHRWSQSWSLKNKRISEIKLDECFTGNARPLCLYAYDAGTLNDDYLKYVKRCIRSSIKEQAIQPHDVSSDNKFKECVERANRVFIINFIANTPVNKCFAEVDKNVDTFLKENCDDRKSAQYKAYIYHRTHTDKFTINASEYYKDTTSRV